MEVARIAAGEHLQLAAVPLDDEQSWQEVAASHRERLRTLEQETQRARGAIHDMRAEVRAVHYLAEKVADLAADIRALTSRIEAVAQHALARPSATGLGVFAQYVAVIVAIVALIVASTH